MITHLLGKLNTDADRARRVFYDDTKWSLDDKVFQSLVSKWGKPDVDLFCITLECKVTMLCSMETRPNGLGNRCFYT